MAETWGRKKRKIILQCASALLVNDEEELGVILAGTYTVNSLQLAKARNDRIAAQPGWHDMDGWEVF